MSESFFTKWSTSRWFIPTLVGVIILVVAALVLAAWGLVSALSSPSNTSMPTPTHSQPVSPTPTVSPSPTPTVSPSPSPTSTHTSTPQPDWVPAGYTLWPGDDEISWEWAKVYTECPPEMTSGCFVVDVVTARDCPSGVDVTIDEFSEAGSALGTASGHFGSLPMKFSVGKVRVPMLEPNATGDVVDITCY